MFLPGNGAKDFRKNAADILTKFFAGDASLVAQIEENAESSHPISQMARASLPPPPTNAIEEKKRKRIEDMEMKERQVALRVQMAQAEISEAKAKKIYAEADVLGAEVKIREAEAKIKEAEAKKIIEESRVFGAEVKIREAQAKKITEETTVIGLGSKKIIAETRIINSEADKLEAESKAKKLQSDAANVIPVATPLLVPDAAPPQDVEPPKFTLIPESICKNLNHVALMRLIIFKFLSAIINTKKYVNPANQELQASIIAHAHSPSLYKDLLQFLQAHNYVQPKLQKYDFHLHCNYFNGMTKKQISGKACYEMYYSTIKAQLIELDKYDAEIKF